MRENGCAGVVLGVFGDRHGAPYRDVEQLGDRRQREAAQWRSGRRAATKCHDGLRKVGLDLPAALRFGAQLGPGLALPVRRGLRLRVSNASGVLVDHCTGPLRDATAKLVAMDRVLTETGFES